MKVLQLTQGKYTFVDDEDYERLWKMGRWSVSKMSNGFYAVKAAKKKDRKSTGTMFLLHRLVLEWADKRNSKLDVDHIDGNSLNNQKKNLRFATRSENMRNSKSSRGSSKYKGVCWAKREQKWKAEIKVPQKKLFLGYHNSEEAAALAYNEAAIKYFRTYANLNKITN